MHENTGDIRDIGEVDGYASQDIKGSAEFNTAYGEPGRARMDGGENYRIRRQPMYDLIISQIRRKFQ
jgi:hypothetical protein